MKEICAFLEATLRGETSEILDLESGETIHSLQGHRNIADPGMTRAYAVNAVALTPDGHHIVSGSLDNTLARLGPGDRGNQNDAPALTE